MTTIFLVRHGEVEGNVGPARTFAGRRDLELTERGRLQAAAVARRLQHENLSAIYASTLQRAWRTADAIASYHELTVERRAALCEVDYGAWEGIGEVELLRDWADLWQQRVADPWNVAPPGGESHSHLWARLESQWTTILERHPDQTIAIVAHSGPIRVLLCQLLGAPPSSSRNIQIDNCSLTKVNVAAPIGAGQAKLAAPRVVLQYINNSAHLEEAP